jgi:hypothetical protein
VLLAVVSDVAYGSQSCLRELAAELKRDGVIDEDSTIDSAGDLLDAFGQASGVTATAFNTPPISFIGLKEMIDQTRDAVSVIDPTKVLPQAEAKRMWDEMHAIATREGVGILDVSSAMTLHALDKVGLIGRGALSSTRAVGQLFDRHVFDHYRAALGDIQEKGFYRVVADTSQPYVDAVWQNFQASNTTLTENLLSGKLVGSAAKSVGRWLGLGEQDTGEG